jgi:7-cyano-7-deazaguanine synthase
MEKMKKAIVLLSGGQDSTISLYWAKKQFDEVQAISFDYGQRHRTELFAAETISMMANVRHKTINVPNILRSTSPLVNSLAPLETYQSYEEMSEIIGDRTELTFVPMRNALFLVIAANYAVHIGSHSIVVGVCGDDAANYPDCTNHFIDAIEHAIKAGLGNSMNINTPLILMNKAESVLLAQSLHGCMEALAYSQTCYQGKYPPCGECHACVLRAEGFRQAGVEDPLIVRARS